MDIEKFALPLTVAASIAALVVFLKGGSGPTAPTAASTLPQPATVPSYASIPYATYNVATPTPPPVAAGTGIDTFAPPTGLTVSKGFQGAPTAKSDIPGNGGACGGCSTVPQEPLDNTDPNNFIWYGRVYLNSAAL